MAHDIFISYSTKDKLIADAICTNLEIAGIRCWIAPRDVTPGLDWPTAISNAISASRVMVLVLSTNSNSSTEVSRELILAANRNLVIIPFKIDDITPEPGKEYYLARTHWLDAMNPPTQEQIDKLTAYARSFLSVQASVETTKPAAEDKAPAKDIVRTPATFASPSAQPVKRRREKLWLWSIPLVLAIAGVSIYGILSIRPGGQSAFPTVITTSMLSPTALTMLTPSPLPVLIKASSQTEVEILSVEISELVTQTMRDSAYTYSAELKPDGKDVSVTLDSFLSGEPESTQNFTLPGDYTCKVSEGVVGYIVELRAKEYWNLGLYEESTANILCDKFMRLNTILEE